MPLAVDVFSGCEKTHNQYFQEQLSKAGIENAPFGWASVQLDGGIDKVSAKVRGIFEEKLQQDVAMERRYGSARFTIGDVVMDVRCQTVASERSSHRTSRSFRCFSPSGRHLRADHRSRRGSRRDRCGSPEPERASDVSWLLEESTDV